MNHPIQFTQNFRPTFLAAGFLSFLFLSVMSGFGQSMRQSTSEEGTAVLDRDAMFVTAAAEFNLEQIRLGKMAQLKGNTKEIISLGAEMQKAHEASLKSLTATAGRSGIIVPTAHALTANVTYDKLKEKSGDDFDKSYADLVISGHKEAIKIYEDAAEKGSDYEIKAWASSALPELRKHLDHAEVCKAKCSEMKIRTSK